MMNLNCGGSIRAHLGEPMKTTVTNKLEGPIEYPHLIRGKPTTAFNSVYAICYEPSRALVVHSGAPNTPPGMIIVNLDYFERYFGVITLES